MAYSREAHDTLEKALDLLKTKSNYPYPRMVGYLMANVSLADAKRVLKLVEEWEGDK